MGESDIVNCEPTLAIQVAMGKRSYTHGVGKLG